MKDKEKLFSLYIYIYNYIRCEVNWQDLNGNNLHKVSAVRLQPYKPKKNPKNSPHVLLRRMCFDIWHHLFFRKHYETQRNIIRETITTTSKLHVVPLFCLYLSTSYK